MNQRQDPRERWRWEEQQEREARDDREVDTRFAQEAGDPRWGTGGMRVDERNFRLFREPSERVWRGGSIQRDAVMRPRPSFPDWESPPQAPPYSSPSAQYGANRGPYVGRGPRGYRRSDDRIREDVCERFTRHGELDPSDVEVSVQDGEVMLSGTVATRVQKRLADDIADAVFGVIEVHNHLRVQRPSGSSARSSEARERTMHLDNSARSSEGEPGRERTTDLGEPQTPRGFAEGGRS